MAVHLSVIAGSPRNETIRFDSAAPGERDTATNLSQRTETTPSDPAAKQIVADKSGNAVAIKLPA